MGLALAKGSCELPSTNPSPTATSAGHGHRRDLVPVAQHVVPLPRASHHQAARLVRRPWAPRGATPRHA
eukprot:4295551-Prymnesium_polylepis.1